MQTHSGRLRLLAALLLCASTAQAQNAPMGLWDPLPQLHSSCSVNDLPACLDDINSVGND